MARTLRLAAALTAVIAGALLVVTDFGYLLTSTRAGGSSLVDVAQSPLYTLTSAVGLVAMLVAALAVVGVHSQQAQRAGVLGLAAAGALIAGLSLAMAVQWFATFALAALAEQAPEFFVSGASAGIETGLLVANVVLVIGSLAYFVVSWEASVYPPWATIAIALSGLTGLASLLVTVPAGQFALLGLGLIGMGMRLAGEDETPADEAAATGDAGGPDAGVEQDVERF